MGFSDHLKMDGGGGIFLFLKRTLPRGDFRSFSETRSEFKTLKSTTQHKHSSFLETISVLR